MNQIEQLKKQLQEAEEAELNNKLQSDLAVYQEKYEGKVHMYIHYTKSAQSVNFTYYKRFFIKENYDKKKVVWYSGEDLELYKTSWTDSIRTYKKDEKEAKPLHEIEYCPTGTLQIISVDEYKAYKKIIVSVIATLQDDIIAGKDFDTRRGLTGYEWDFIAAVEKTKDILDIKHIIVNDREGFLLGKSVFLNGNCYFLSPNSIKFALNRLDEELKSDNFGTSLLAQAGYRNRNSRAGDIIALQNKFKEIQQSWQKN